MVPTNVRHCLQMFGKVYNDAYKHADRCSTVPTNVRWYLQTYRQLFGRAYKHTDNCSAEPTNMPTNVRRSLQLFDGPCTTLFLIYRPKILLCKSKKFSSDYLGSEYSFNRPLDIV